MKIYKILLVPMLFAAIFFFFFPACSVKSESRSGESGSSDITVSDIPLSSDIEAYPISVAIASGIQISGNAKVTLDYSNTADGYVMLKYTGTKSKVKTRITGPSGETYTYNQSLKGNYYVYSLSDGSGSYKIGVYENISDTSYSMAFSFTFSAALRNEFAPFLISNKYINYNASSKIVKKSFDLCADKKTTLEKIGAIYKYVLGNYSYDYVLAKTVQSGYIPNLDALIKKKTGICFDYAAVMTAMLRCQGIPTKMVFGYTGSVYHAWISTYSEESGWITASIYFNGKEWKLMDPTFASTGKSSAAIIKYIENGDNYTEKYLY